MKKIIRLFTIQGLLISGTILGQNTDSLTLKDLEIPNSSAFILLDKTPTTIERPNSSKAFMLSILNTFEENQGLPKNYAVDFTPFWFFKHPNMTSLKYMGYNKEKNKQTIFHGIKKASVSFAFVNTIDSLTDEQINNFALGLRTNIISVRSKKDIQDIKDANTKVVRYLKDVNDRINDSIPLDLAITNPSEYQKRVQAFLQHEEQREKKDKNGLSEILKRRPVFAVDCAIGYNSFFLDKNFSSHHFGRFGAWITANYSKGLTPSNPVGKNYINLYVLGRYLSDGTLKENDGYIIQDYYDTGGKLELEFQHLSIAYEYIYRSNSDMNTFRSNGLIKYKISGQIVLTGAFGKNFGEGNNLISLLGIHWGLSAGNEKTMIKQ